MRPRCNLSSPASTRLWVPIAALVLCTAVVRPGHGECHWEALANAPQAGRVDDMFFLDAETGWCVNSSGQIHHTEDGGATWVQQLQRPNYLRSITFIDSLRGWAGALDGYRLYQTSDGGTNWSPVMGLPGWPPGRICGMAAVDTNSVIACGAYDGTPGYLRTDDAGASWIARDLSQEVSTLVDVYFLDPQNGFLVGGADGAYPDEAKSVILRTEDGGTTWTRRFTGTLAGEWCWKIFFLTDQIGFVSVENYTAASVLKTVDGGFTWQEFTVSNNADIEGVGFVDESLGWVGGWEYTSESTDGGSTWTTVGWGTLLNRFVRISPTLAYASGTTVYKWTCDPTAATEASTPVRSPLALTSYPNPFNASTTIAFDVPTTSHVLVRIYDALGKRIRDLLDTRLPAGPHAIEWDGRDDAGATVASGVYLYRVDAAGTAESRSMVLVK